jgi:hypothetical protein
MMRIIAALVTCNLHAALTFSGTNLVTLTNSSSMNNLTAWTMIYWINPTTNIGQLHRQSTTGFRRTAILNANDIANTVARSTSDDDYTVNNASLTTGQWTYLAFVYNSTASGNERFNVYKGTITSIAAELTYSNTTNGSGTVSFTGDVVLANRSTGNDPFLGAMAFVGQWNRALTLDEIRQQQFRPRVTSGCITFLHMGFGDTSTVRDWSGTGNNGTITGATYSAHPPIGAPFAMWRATWRELWSTM